MQNYDTQVRQEQNIRSNSNLLILYLSDLFIYGYYADI